MFCVLLCFVSPRPQADIRLSTTAAFASFSGIFSLHSSLTGEKKKMETQWPDPTGVPSEHHPQVLAGKHSRLSASAQPLLWLMLDLEALLRMGCKCIIPLPYK